MFELEKEGDDLDGFTESHVVCEACAEAELGHGVEPGESGLLVRAEGGAEVRIVGGGGA